MKKFGVLMLVNILCTFLFVSCTPQGEPATINSSSTQPINKSEIKTAQPTSTLSYHEKPQPLSDGRLKLTLLGLGKQCYKVGAPINITLQYENLTSQPITIVDYRAYSVWVMEGGKGQLYPVILSSNGRELLTREHFILVDLFNPSSPALKELAPKTKFRASFQYAFPTEITDPENQMSETLHRTPPGIYLLRFFYKGFEHNGYWEGTISSNTIEVCITN